MTVYCTKCGGDGLILAGLCNSCGISGQFKVYKDKCYCNSRSCSCSRVLSSKVEREAEGLGMPLAVGDLRGNCNRRKL